MEDNQIIDLYWERSETAISETEKKYGRYCHYIAYQILENDEDAREIVNDTYLKTWKTIPRPVLLKSYVGMISRQLALDCYEKKHTKKRSGQITLILNELSECIADTDSNTDMGENVALRDALNSFVWTLPEKTQKIFVRRYWYSSPIAEIAREYSMKESAVTVLLLRTRKKLKDYLHKEDINI